MRGRGKGVQRPSMEMVFFFLFFFSFPWYRSSADAYSAVLDPVRLWGCSIVFLILWLSLDPTLDSS